MKYRGMGPFPLHHGVFRRRGKLHRGDPNEESLGPEEHYTLERAERLGHLAEIAPSEVSSLCDIWAWNKLDRLTPHKASSLAHSPLGGARNLSLPPHRERIRAVRAGFTGTCPLLRVSWSWFGSEASRPGSPCSGTRLDHLTARIFILRHRPAPGPHSPYLHPPSQHMHP